MPGSNGAQALIVVALFVSFMVGTLAIILLISRRRKLGKAATQMESDFEYSKLMNRC